MDPAINLAQWILANQRGEVSHLKLQKLLFYCYGGALATRLDDQIGRVPFEAWEHGPVNRKVWTKYRSFGSSPLSKDNHPPNYADKVNATLSDVLCVYGRLDAWDLREESHQEAPWRETWTRALEIDESRLRAHFIDKFASGRVRCPDRIFGGSSFELDRVPVPHFASLHELAAALSDPDG